jgi:hypothetical protein
MPSANYISSGMSFDNYLNMFNKICNNEKKKFLLLEYGLLTSFKNIMINEISNSRFYLDPNILIGV